MSLLAWIVLGGLAGWIATALLKERRGCLMNIILGVLGAVLGGLIFSVMGEVPVTGLNLGSLCVAVVGSLVLLILARLARGR